MVVPTHSSSSSSSSSPRSPSYSSRPLPSASSSRRWVVMARATPDRPGACQRIASASAHRRVSSNNFVTCSALIIERRSMQSYTSISPPLAISSNQSSSSSSSKSSTFSPYRLTPSKRSNTMTTTLSSRRRRRDRPPHRTDVRAVVTTGPSPPGPNRIPYSPHRPTLRRTR